MNLITNGNIRVESSIVGLGTIHPVLNGIRLQNAHLNPEKSHLLYTFSEGYFFIDFQQDGERLWLKYGLENLREDVVLRSFGLRFEGLENLRTCLRNGYFSWDGSFYVDAENPPEKAKPGYAMTQLLPRYGTGSVIIGFDRHERFQHTFEFEHNTLTIQTLWDEKNRDGLQRIDSERLVIFEHPEVENALRAWANIVADAAPIKPRNTSPHITGWCSWYNLYAYITEENILDHLHGAAEVARRENLPLRVFQIDDGFTPEMGDWLEVKPQFPRGMKPLLDDIRAAGFIPGLWIGPFMVGNRSHLYQEHPDWVVIDRETGKPLVQMHFYGEFRWHKRSEEYYILDTTHPEAFNYLRQVFRTWRHEWGCEYFKTDFMHFGSEHGPDRAVWHQPGMTRIEIWRRVAEMIREEIGDALWLGCGCPLWASVGLVDGVRIGRDVGVEWAGNFSAESLLRDQATRNFANHILWQADPDCILLRERFHHLTDAEIRSLAIYAGMNAGVITTSDDLSALSPERIRLFKLLLRENRSGCDFPLLGQSTVEPVLVQVRKNDTLAAVFIFNAGEAEVQRRYPLSLLGLPDNQYAFNRTAERALEQPVSSLSVTLPPHDSVLFFLSPEPFNSVPEMLP